MSLLDDARTIQEQHSPGPVPAKAKRDYPTGFEPGLDTQNKTITAKFDRPLQDTEVADEFTKLLEDWGFDPKRFAIEDDRVEIRTWDAHYGVNKPPKRFWYYKARVIYRSQPIDISGLVERISKKKALTKKREFGGDRAFVVFNADWQLGKRDGPGTEFTIRAVKESIPLLKERYKTLRKQGHALTDLVIVNLGDLVEGCAGHYPMQTFNVELSRREQVRLGRELLTEQIMAWADDFDRVLVVTVPGNHGENRNDDGKSFTNLGDNDDIALVEQVAEAFDLAKKVSTRYDHVKFAIPNNELNVVIDVQGTIVGVTHGHVANTRRASGRNLAHTKVWDWWQGQMFGRMDVQDVDLLVSGHYHYLSLIEQGGRTAFQAPSLEGGSEWFTGTHGVWATAAISSMVVGGGRWEALDVTPVQRVVDVSDDAA